MATNPAGPADPIAAWRAMLLAHSRSVRAIEADMRSNGQISLTWYDVLLELHAAKPALRMQELGERVVLSRTRVSRLVDDLEAGGLVMRQPDPGDGRATIAQITSAGSRALRTAAPHYLKNIEDHFTRHLTQTEQGAIARGLGKVVAAHDDSAQAR